MSHLFISSTFRNFFGQLSIAVKANKTIQSTIYKLSPFPRQKKIFFIISDSLNESGFTNHEIFGPAHNALDQKTNDDLSYLFLFYESRVPGLVPHSQLTLVPRECDRLQISVCADTFPASPGVSLRWLQSLTVVSVITSTLARIRPKSLTYQTS